MERQFFAVTDDMVVALAGIGITVTDHRLYLIVSPEGAVRIVPVNVESENDYDHTRERGLIPLACRGSGSAQPSRLRSASIDADPPVCLSTRKAGRLPIVG